MDTYRKERLHYKDEKHYSDFFLNCMPIDFTDKDWQKKGYNQHLYFGESSVIGNFLRITMIDDLHNRNCKFYTAELTDELINFVKDNMLAIDNDQISFELFIYPDNTAMLIASYSQIIGNRWIAMIDINSIPIEFNVTSN